jgi:hypothetical protein
MSYYHKLVLDSWSPSLLFMIMKDSMTKLQTDCLSFFFENVNKRIKYFYIGDSLFVWFHINAYSINYKISTLLRIVTNILSQKLGIIVLVLTQKIGIIILILTQKLGIIILILTQRPCVIRTVQFFPLAVIFPFSNETHHGSTEEGGRNNNEEGRKIPGFGNASLGGQAENDGEVQCADGEQVGDETFQSS